MRKTWSKVFEADARTHNMRARNRYPREIVDVMEREFGLRPGQHGADVAAGSGRLSALFLAQGYAMTAIDWREQPLKLCTCMQERWKEFAVGFGTPTATGLADGSVDFVVSQRGLYWPDRPALKAEVRRILRSGGAVLLIADSRVYSGAAQTEAYEALLRAHCPGFREKRVECDIAATVAEFFAGVPVYEDAFVSEHALTLDALIDETRALPICPVPGDANYQPMLRALRDHFDRWAVDGALAVPNVCRIACGRLA